MKMKYIFFALLTMVFCFSCNTNKQRTDWQIKMESQYKIPYGTYILREELAENLFVETSYITTIKGNTKAFIDSLIMDGKTNATFLYVNAVNHINYDLVKQLNVFAQQNNVFISSWDFSSFFEEYPHFSRKFIAENNGIAEFKLLNIDSSVKTYSIHTKNEPLFYFDTVPYNAEILGTISVRGKEYPNYIKLHTDSINCGIYFHANPQFFANYYLLNKNDYRYAFDVLAYLSKTTSILWDGYRTEARYSDDNVDGSSSSALRYIWSQPPLKWAFLLFFSALVLFLMFNYKRVREQSSILVPPTNNTLSFVRTVAILFMREKNNSDLVRIKINFLLDKIRMNYLLNTEDLNLAFIEKLALKSTVDVGQVSEMITLIRQLREQQHVSAKEFYALNQTIEQFTLKSNLYDRK